MSEKSPIAKMRYGDNQQVTTELLKRYSHGAKMRYGENQQIIKLLRL